ncbi:MAG: PIN domain-containing protein [Candidatus Melainabacteria bacterium]|nr:PIN domain-containing protein [Candidatus Melainabacteria bacterium]
MKQSVYLDTTIFSYYVDERSELDVHIKRTREWWNNEKHFYDLYISNFVLEELKGGNFPNQIYAIKLTKGIHILNPIEQVDKIIEIYLKNKLMPLKDTRDALHLAFASVYKIDILLTWNCAHLANVNKKIHMKNINATLGLFLPEIVTPLELRV